MSVCSSYRLETLKAHFEQFGEVSDSVIMVDPQTHQPRYNEGGHPHSF